MTIYDKGLIRAMKQAYRDSGYDVAVTDNGVLIQASGWGVEIVGEAVHAGLFSRAGEAVSYTQGGGSKGNSPVGEKHGDLAARVGGQLNPTWVEWLMGFPLGWTDLNVSEMPSCPSSSTPSFRE